LVDAGVPSGRFLCQWYQPGDTNFMRRQILFNLFGPVGRLTPADRFANDKAAATGIAKMATALIESAAAPKFAGMTGPISTAPPSDEIYRFSSPICSAMPLVG
jgi:hypothetical protein